MNPVSCFGMMAPTLPQRKLKTPEEFQKLATWIRAYGQQIEQIITRMKRSVAENTTSHRLSVDCVPARLDSLIGDADNVTESMFYSQFGEPFNNVTNNETIKQSIRETATDNIYFVLKNLKALKDYTVKTYIPHTRTTLGVHGLPRGREYYQALLRWHLSMDVPAEQLHQTGLREVERISREIHEIKLSNGFHASNREYFDTLMADEANVENNSVNVLNMCRDIHSQRIVPKLTEVFADIPVQHLEFKGLYFKYFMAAYKNAALDGSRKGIFYISVPGPVGKFFLPSLIMHEADPGHHLQDAYALTNPTIPMFRRAVDFSKYFAAPMHFPFYTAYSEGWGLYSEDLGEVLGIYETYIERLGKLGMEQLRAARLVVDTGIHAKGWTFDKAVDYMLNATVMPRDDVEYEVVRSVTWPGHVCAYTFGKLKIHELKAKAMQLIGQRFNIKEFHSLVLKNGAMPLRVMEDIVDDWIRRVKSVVLLGNHPDSSLNHNITASSHTNNGSQKRNNASVKVILVAIHAISTLLFAPFP
ncbi:hypothetical protein DPMN_162629 [Dreissena polymorpha]|uniref:Uncharacterized protein n=2 Tax=Dreissena polymorpha TaxID=45954 RepID=A0A9D4ERV6_DREPO|nr:hypothetical protein DPMN_162629 [Dreissena polymorpha]